MHSVVANRYAHALASVILAPGSKLTPEAAITQLKSVEELLDSASEIKHVMLSPAVASSKKRAVMGQLAGEMTLNPKIQNFLFVIIDHRRIDQLAGIREALETALDEAIGLLKAHITSAQPLDDSQRAALQGKFESLTGKKIRADYTVDSDLIGGVIARIGSTVYDGSVRGQFEGLRRKLVTQA